MKSQQIDEIQIVLTWKVLGPWLSLELPSLEAIWYTRGINL